MTFVKFIPLQEPCTWFAGGEIKKTRSCHLAQEITKLITEEQSEDKIQKQSEIKMERKSPKGLLFLKTLKQGSLPF